ncbi:MAG: arylsulfatase A-like enzyme [Granulosicoccus sp.]
MDSPKNILFIGVDQLRYDVIGPYKTVDVHTPNIDYLISSGVSFSRAYTSCPLCTPARASMYTGDYAFKHGMGTNCDMYHALAKELPTPDALLHQDLLRENYRCLHMGKWHVGVEKGPLAFGFEGLDLPGYGHVTASEDYLEYLKDAGYAYEIKPTLYFNEQQQTMSAGLWQGPVESTPAHYLTSRTLQKLDHLAGCEQSFFLSVQYWDPHGPHLLPKEYYGKTDRSKIRQWTNFTDNLTNKPVRIKRERDDFYRLHPRTEEEVIEYIGLYCDHVAMLDVQIGRLIKQLNDSGLVQDTLIIFTSDHGDMTGSHGGLIDKGLLYEEAMRVPLVFNHRSLKPGVRTGLAMNMDALPTALSLVGVATSPFQAMDLSEQLCDETQTGREYLLGEFHGLRFLYSQRMLVSDNGWKFIFTPGDYDELYNLNVDPFELHNLITTSELDAETSKQLSRMKNALVMEMSCFNDPLRDCAAKFQGNWTLRSDQFDVTQAFLKV